MLEKWTHPWVVKLILNYLALLYETQKKIVTLQEIFKNVLNQRTLKITRSDLVENYVEIFTVFTCKNGNIKYSYIPALFRFSFNSDIKLEEKLWINT